MRNLFIIDLNHQLSSNLIFSSYKHPDQELNLFLAFARRLSSPGSSLTLPLKSSSFANSRIALRWFSVRDFGGFI